MGRDGVLLRGGGRQEVRKQIWHLFFFFVIVGFCGKEKMLRWILVAVRRVSVCLSVCE